MKLYSKEKMIQDKPTKIYWTVKEVAELCGVSKATIYYWEKALNIKRGHMTKYTADNVEQIKVGMGKLIDEMHSLEAKIKELDQELDHYLVDLVEQRLEYIYKLIASNTK